jgi:chitin synthase
MPWIHFVNVYLDYAYFGLLIVCYILALGSRPQDTERGYIVVFLGFGLITLHMTVRPVLTQMPLSSLLSTASRKGAGFFLMIKCIQDLLQNPIQTGSLTLGEFLSALFVENILGELVVTLAAYTLASIACVSSQRLFSDAFAHSLISLSLGI